MFNKVFCDSRSRQCRCGTEVNQRPLHAVDQPLAVGNLVAAVGARQYECQPGVRGQAGEELLQSLQAVRWRSHADNPGGHSLGIQGAYFMG